MFELSEKCTMLIWISRIVLVLMTSLLLLGSAAGAQAQAESSLARHKLGKQERFAGEPVPPDPIYADSFRTSAGSSIDDHFAKIFCI